VLVLVLVLARGRATTGVVGVAEIMAGDLSSVGQRHVGRRKAR